MSQKPHVQTSPDFQNLYVLIEAVARSSLTTRYLAYFWGLRARRYASAVFAVIVCPSVRLSQAG